MIGFPLPYRDELIYSTIARHGVHSGITSPKELLYDVFGDRKIIATSDLPSHLGQIARLYPHSLGITPERLLYENTLFPLYAPFIGETRRRAIVKTLTVNKKCSAHLSLGAAASRVQQSAYLRYCPGCIELQLKHHGELCWIRAHQVTGADVCPLHGELVDSSIRRHDVHRHQFQAASLDACTVYQQNGGDEKNKLLSTSVSELLNVGDIRVPEFEQWSSWYRYLAISNNFSKGRKIIHRSIREKVVSFWGTKRLASYGLITDGSESNWLTCIFRKHRKAFSYLEHLVVLHAFMGETLGLKGLIDDVARSVVIPKAERQSMPVFNKCRLLEYRRIWRSVVKKIGAKRARVSRCGGIYIWLYRHDPDWLVAANRRFKNRTQCKVNKVDWKARDIKIVKQLVLIRDARVLLLHDPRHSKNWYLNQLAHKTTIEKRLSKLPLTRLFFDRYCESIFEYQIRRITRTILLNARGDMEFAKCWLLRKSGLSEERLTSQAKLFIKDILRL